MGGVVEKIRWPNTHCPQREQCMKSKTRWIACGLRKEYIFDALMQKENSIKKRNIFQYGSEAKKN